MQKIGRGEHHGPIELPHPAGGPALRRGRRQRTSRRSSRGYLSPRLGGRYTGGMSVVTGHPRITVEPDKLGGKPCIRGLRISVAQVLAMRAGGMTEEEILDDFPSLEPDDFPAIYEYASQVTSISPDLQSLRQS